MTETAVFGSGHDGGDGGDVAVVEVDRLMESAAECGGEASEDVMACDMAIANARPLNPCPRRSSGRTTRPAYDDDRLGRILHEFEHAS